MPVRTRQAARRERLEALQHHAHPSQLSEEQQQSRNGPSAEEDSTELPKPRERFGLVQERYQHNLYHLVVQAILWNQTRGTSAIVILKKLIVQYPDPKALAAAESSQLESLLQPIGLHRSRAKRLILMAQEWVNRPPTPSIVYPVRHKEKDRDEQWEIAHLPGVGKYALDSYRIFGRDQLLSKSFSWDDRYSTNSDNKATEPDFEPEWKRVLPQDKDLRRFLQWAWHLEGWHWDPLTGRKVRSLLPDTESRETHLDQDKSASGLS